MIKLKLLRFFNKHLFKATLNERLSSEKLFKNKEVYEYINLN